MEKHEPRALADSPAQPATMLPSPAAPLVVVHNHPAESGLIESEEGKSTADVDQLKAILAYLGSEPGHEIAGRTIGVIEKLQRDLSARGTTTAKWERIIQGVIVAIVIASCVTLAALGKFSNEVGIVFVALLGLVFQKKA